LVEKVLTLLEQIAQELHDLNNYLGNREEKPGDGDRTMFPQEAAEYLGVSYDTVLRWAREGIIPSSKPGGQRVLFRRSALDEYLAKHEKERTPQRGNDEGQYGQLRKIIA